MMSGRVEGNEQPALTSIKVTKDERMQVFINQSSSLANTIMKSIDY